MLRNHYAKKGKSHQHKAKLQYQAEYKRPEHRRLVQGQVTANKNKSVDHSDNRELSSEQKLFCLMIAINLLIFMVPQVKGESTVQQKDNLNRSQFDKHSMVSSHSMFNHTSSSEKSINDIQSAQMQPKTLLPNPPEGTIFVCSPINDKCVAIRKDNNRYEYAAYLSQDKGQTWQSSEKVGDHAYLSQIHDLKCGTDGTHCVAVGNRGSMSVYSISLRTADSGSTWIESYHIDDGCNGMPHQRGWLKVAQCDDAGLDCTAQGYCSHYESGTIQLKTFTAKV